MRIPTSRRGSTAVVVLAVLAALVVPVGCSGSGTREVEARDDGQQGPLPTAPANFSRNGPGEESALTGSVDVNDLIRRIDALTQEDDLCTLLTGQAMADVTGADVDLTSLLSNPTGFSQLFGALESVFTHMIEIAPSDLSQPLATMRSTWATLATLDLSSPGADTEAGALISSPELLAAQDSLGTWVVQNCT